MKWFKGKDKTPNEPGHHDAGAAPVLLTPESYSRSTVGVGGAASFEQLDETARAQLREKGDVLPVRAGKSISALIQRDGVVLLPLGTELELSLLEFGQRVPLLTINGLFSTSSLSANLDFDLRVKRDGEVLVLGRAVRGRLEGEAAAFLSGGWEGQSVALLQQALTLVGKRVSQCNQLAVFWIEQQRSRFEVALRSQRVQAILEKIPKLPVSSSQLLSLLLDETSSRAGVVELVKRDSTLASMLLKAINSPRYALENKISDINRAVALLGFESVYQIIMGASLQRCLPDEPEFQASQQRCLDLSFLAFAVARVSGRGNPSEISTLALMQDLGLVVQQEMRDRAGGEFLLADLLDRETLGALLLKSWRVPDAIWESLVELRAPWFVPPPLLSPEHADSVATLFVAAMLYERYVRQLPVTANARVGEYLEYLGINGSLAHLWEIDITPQLKRRGKALPQTLLTAISLGNDSTS